MARALPDLSAVFFRVMGRGCLAAAVPALERAVDQRRFIRRRRPGHRFCTGASAPKSSGDQESVGAGG